MNIHGKGWWSAMAMSHKAYSFDWWSFEIDLRPLLEKALIENDSTTLEAYIDANRAELTDPFEGETLPEDWRSALANRDVHEYGDYALTRLYDVNDDSGIHEAWAEVSERLPTAAANALLGFSVGPAGRLFDPGRYGSYFQTPAQVRDSLAILKPLGVPDLTRFVELLARCVVERRGVYVTF